LIESRASEEPFILLEIIRRIGLGVSVTYTAGLLNIREET
jgi:hypothetical protein